MKRLMKFLESFVIGLLIATAVIYHFPKLDILSSICLSLLFTFVYCILHFINKYNED